MKIQSNVQHWLLVSEEMEGDVGVKRWITQTGRIVEVTHKNTDILKIGLPTELNPICQFRTL
jgi:hypothetical protein